MTIAFEDFQKLDLRVGTIKEAEEIAGADKLFKLKVETDITIQLVAGIKGYYTKEEIIGKKVAVLTNLEPRIIRGVESQGMLLAAVADDRQNLSLITLDKDISTGTKIS
jgi:methionyl-tRNA synthetase